MNKESEVISIFRQPEYMAIMRKCIITDRELLVHERSGTDILGDDWLTLHG